MAFRDCTVITIAHRLNTGEQQPDSSHNRVLQLLPVTANVTDDTVAVLDSNRVLVMADGLVAEFASPSSLLADTHSIFHGLARDAGILCTTGQNKEIVSFSGGTETIITL